MTSLSPLYGLLLLTVFGIMNATLPGCSAEENLCQAASEHLAQCFPGVEIPRAEVCDEDEANDILHKDCEQLQQ